MLVMAIQRRGSRRSGNGTADLLSMLRGHDGATTHFDRVTTDLVRGVLEDPAVAVDVALDVLRHGGWTVGIGTGAVDEPLPRRAVGGSGQAFDLANRALERAGSRQRPVPLVVLGADREHAADAEAVLTLMAAVLAKRTEGGWAAIDAGRAAGRAATQEDVAARLGVSQQAVSQRLAAALWHEEQAVRPVAARLLAQAQGRS
ncbi:hypothetical protein OEB99_09730 [Actinotalea sp. M2MS4P-6]|uniref:hypothetical protein n=1 Tax=Actinotalea sp. M2MS4P-6 TaxID=2983762 RepID=UPI0021E4DBD2|nr:hypothetical protein [Actinotalea sp. M2MS4P-6]MCV2394585.1 hypothetical protein [Actinotalea sp. M2MS4P-6]